MTSLVVVWIVGEDGALGVLFWAERTPAITRNHTVMRDRHIMQPFYLGFELVFTTGYVEKGDHPCSD
jgi:hypothetical protein